MGVYMLGRALAVRALFLGGLLAVGGMVYGQEFLTVDTARRYQVMDNFAASDAWSCQFVGGWPDAKRRAMADWLFSMDTLKDGSPKGIGLTMWRFNIGAGTAEQGDGSGIRDVWRRTEASVDPAGGVVVGAQAGQRWFVRAARERGVKQVVGFLNSPPVWLTKNGKGFASHGVSNIDASRFGEFARWMVRNLMGLDPEWVSPVNEPQWDWSDGGQEGCPYSNAEVAGLVRVLNGALDSAGLKTKILLPEAGSIKYLFEVGDKPGRGRQIEAFFGSGSANYVGGLSRVGGVVAAHSYFSTAPWERGIGWRRRVDSLVSARGVRYWQSEFCILGDDAGEISGNHRDTGMTAALYMARVIHNDLVYANASAWQWWLAISPYDYKDGLIYVDRSEKDGKYRDSKKLWALGNFSRFVRPGMERVGVGEDGVSGRPEGLSGRPEGLSGRQERLSGRPAHEEGLLVSAFRDVLRRKLVVVMSNLSGGARELSLERVGGSGWCSYLTSEESNLRKTVVKGRKVTVPGRSICTLTANY
ncbi:MAG: xylanase [Bacteroidetes bacterium]|nr:xylanase [Bacteroidota bacterium]